MQADQEIAEGERLLSQLDYEGAFKHFDKAARLDPKNALAHFGKAESALGIPTVEAEEIAALYRKAIDLESGNPQFLEAYASFCMDLGRFNEAEQYYNQAAEIDVDNAHFYLSEFAIGYRKRAPIVMEKFLDEKTSDMIAQKSLTYMLKALNMSKEEARRLLQ